jgi:aspartyl-tRNA(Asn)/glutamyl-tRNA(Gln) amidotransferase subunit A
MTVGASLTRVEDLQTQIRQGAVSVTQLVEVALDRIHDPAGQGESTFITTFDEEALALAQQQNQELAKGHALQALTGVTVSVKDLFDTQGHTTTSGSLVLRQNPPATKDAEVIDRLRQAGAIVVGRTTMTEFAYSGLGLNPHYGTPLNPFERDIGRIPGGSTSGGVISVTDGMATIAMGSDTGGSCRIPAALCGVVGFKSTAARYSQEGVLPLSHSLDSVGFLAPSVACCIAVDQVLAKEEYWQKEVAIDPTLQIGVLQNVVLEGLDADVKSHFVRSLQILQAKGAHLHQVHSMAIDRVIEIQGQPRIVAAQAHAQFEEILNTQSEQMDPRIASRIIKGKDVSSAIYIRTMQEREQLIAAWQQEFAGDAVWIMPTVPIIAPRLSELEQDDAYFRINALMLRNPGLFNFLDGCAISIPNHQLGHAPTGLMLVAPAGHDQQLLAIARLIEQQFATSLF